MYIKHSTSLGGFDILHSVCSDFTFAPHSHEEIVIATYIDGKKHYKCYKSEGLAQTGDLLIIGSDVAHSARSVGETNWQYLSIYLSNQQIIRATGLSPNQVYERCGSHKMVTSQQGGAQIGSEMIQSLLEPQSSDSELALSIFLVNLMSSIQPKKAPSKFDHRNISQVYEFIKEEALNDYSLEQLSELAHVSREHLCRAFKSTYGLTPFQLRASVRAGMARKYIQSGYQLTEAASAANFSDQSHMNRWFNKVYGVSPSQFQNHQ